MLDTLDSIEEEVNRSMGSVLRRGGRCDETGHMDTMRHEDVTEKSCELFLKIINIL